MAFRFSVDNSEKLKTAILRAANSQSTIIRLTYDFETNEVRFKDMKNKRPDNKSFEKYIVVCKMNKTNYSEFLLSFGGAFENNNVFTYGDFVYFSCG